jgi:hypothetical protein
VRSGKANAGIHSACELEFLIQVPTPTVMGRCWKSGKRSKPRGMRDFERFYDFGERPPGEPSRVLIEGVTCRPGGESPFRFRRCFQSALCPEDN